MSRTPELIESEDSEQAEMTRDTWPRWSDCSIRPRKSPPQSRSTARWPRAMRPRRLDEFVGQEHLLGEGSALRASLESGAPHSMVLYGPPGTGKTTLARLAAEHAERGVRGAVGGQRRAAPRCAR